MGRLQQRIMSSILIMVLALLLLPLSSCYESESLNVPEKDPEYEPRTALDKYIEENFTIPLGIAIRYRYVDNYVATGVRVTPPKLEAVKPMLDFITHFWIEPYFEIANGGTFFKQHVPSEIIFLGGFIYNTDGTVTLGTADAGARITFTNVNAIDPTDESWRTLQLQTVYHEFAHIVHQEYKLPASYETISPTGYSGPGSWFTLSDEAALQRGFVSPYATSSTNEDFAETVAFYLFDENFFAKFIEEENCQTADCVRRNEGRALIEQKLSAIAEHYEKNTGVNLEALREAIQARL